MVQDPMVSVIMITYNHEKYIEQAIEGVMIQQTSFSFELIIGEDCSTDKTRQICLEYRDRYPDKIKLLLPDSNQGMMQNFYSTLREPKGNYIALCDGDDYWIDPYKLQKQVDFLNANQDYSICFTKSDLLIDDKFVEDNQTNDIPSVTTINYLIYGNYIRTNTVVFRNNKDVFRDLEKIKTPAGDFLLHLLNAKYGKIRMLDDITGVYRHGVGIWSAQNDWHIKLKTLIIYGTLLGHFDERINSELENIFLRKLLELFENRITEEQHKEIYDNCINYSIDKEIFTIIFSKYIQMKREQNSIKAMLKRIFQQILHRASER